jgi:DNA-directed RNA polymerase subunit RPC12/RpoP
MWRRLSSSHRFWRRMPHTDISCSDGIVCPFCHHTHTDDLYDIAANPEEYECEICGRSFMAWGEISYTYYSEKREGG